MKESTRVLLALGAGLLGGVLIAISGNDGLLRAADAIVPIGTVWINAIRMTVIPLVVSLLVTGVAGAADLRAIGRIGGRSLLTFFLLLTGTAVVIMPVGVLAFRLLGANAARPPLPAGAAEAAGQIAAEGAAPGFGAWLTSLIPTNPIAAAADGAMLQLILFTLILALAIAKLAPAVRDPVLGVFRGLAEAMLVIVRWVVALAPLGVFALVLPLAARGGAGVAGAVGFYVVAYSLASILVVLLLYPVVMVAGKVPIGRFARAVLPAQSVAFASSSSIASLPALVEGAERVLELPARVSGFVVPLAVSTFKIAAPVSWTLGALFIGWFYGIPLSLGALATVAFASIFLAFAAPGVPRGAFLMLTPLFLAIGLPAEGIGILIAVDAIPDLFATVLNVTGDLAA
ncbi:MAG TPA: cation:dicarboxylase symporter family transporter, partial [Gemmatimonadaceae bacterium]